MRAFMLAVPLKKDHEEKWKHFVNALQHEKKADCDRLMKQLGVTHSRIWLEQNGGANETVIYLHEGHNPEHMMETLGKMTEPFAKWYIEVLKDAHGIDVLNFAHDAKTVQYAEMHHH